MPLRLLVWASLLSACHTDPPFSLDYDKSCLAVDECVAEVQRGHCGYSCDRWIALNELGAEAFEQDQDRHFEKHQCRESGLVGCYELADPAEISLRCTNELCQVDTPEVPRPGETPTGGSGTVR